MQGLRDLVTEYADGRMVTTPKQQLTPEFRLDFRESEKKARVLAIVSVSEDTWVAHGYLMTFNEVAGRVEHTRHPYIPNAFSFRVSDADIALRVLFASMDMPRAREYRQVFVERLIRRSTSSGN